MRRGWGRDHLRRGDTTRCCTHRVVVPPHPARQWGGSCAMRRGWNVDQAFALVHRYTVTQVVPRRDKCLRSSS